MTTRNVEEKHFFIGKLAERAGVTPDAVRYYEQIGVMPEPSRTASGYRTYDSTDVERVGFIRQAQVLGLTLDEVTEVLSLVEAGRTPCEHVRERLVRRLEETRRRIHELHRLEGRLVEALGRAEEGADHDSGCRCHIIEGTSRRGGG